MHVYRHSGEGGRVEGRLRPLQDNRGLGGLLPVGRRCRHQRARKLHLGAAQEAVQHKIRQEDGPVRDRLREDVGAVGQLSGQEHGQELPLIHRGGSSGVGVHDSHAVRQPVHQRGVPGPLPADREDTDRRGEGRHRRIRRRGQQLQLHSRDGQPCLQGRGRRCRLFLRKREGLQHQGPRLHSGAGVDGEGLHGRGVGCYRVRGLAQGRWDPERRLLRVHVHRGGALPRRGCRPHQFLSVQGARREATQRAYMGLRHVRRKL